MTILNPNVIIRIFGGLDKTKEPFKLRNLGRSDIQIVGIAESNRELMDRYAKEFSLDKNILFESLDQMLEQTKPEGVITFTSISDHLEVVKSSAPRGIHVMVEKPISVFAQLKRYKPDVYPKVDDDATIVLSYPNMEGIINASWNWPFNRKDMHIYGTTGYAFIDNAETIRYRLNEKTSESVKKVPLTDAPFNDPFTFFAAAIRGKTVVLPTDLSSLEVNMTVVEILEAARKSSKTGKKIKIK